MDLFNSILGGVLGGLLAVVGTRVILGKEKRLSLERIKNRDSTLIEKLTFTFSAMPYESMNVDEIRHEVEACFKEVKE